MTKRRNSGPAGNGGWKWTNNATVASVFGVLLTLGIGAVVAVNSRLNTIDVELGKIKQSIADGGAHEIVSQLKSATSPAEVAAQMTVIKGQIQLATAQGKKANQEKITTLTPAIAEAAHKYPEVAESWSTLSTLVTSRTSTVKFPTGVTEDQLPDCDSENQQRQLIQPEEVGLTLSQMSPQEGYVFKNCHLYLDRLPGKSLKITIKPGDVTDPTHGAGGSAHIGVFAFAENAVIVWRGTLSDTDILGIRTTNCRYEFETDSTPTPKGQTLLLAALESPVPGSGVLKLN
jgi:hypothetical protein